MLFAKKIHFSVSEKQIKEEIKSAEGDTLLRINIRYPELICPKRDPLLRFALPFYKQFAENFAEYARRELIKTAQKAKNASADTFLPFAAVMRWEKTYENERFVSFFIDISVSNVNSPPVTERHTQVWERERGTKCRTSLFFEPETFESLFNSLVGKERKKQFDRELFVLRENGLEFFLRTQGGYTPILFPF